MNVTARPAAIVRANWRNAAHRSVALLLATGFGFFAAAAHAETFVLVYEEGSVVALPGGSTVSKGEEIDGDKLVQLGPADQAIFVSQAGNVIRHNGPFCGPVSESQDSGSPSAQTGCQK